jgi:hypothetical protein
MDVIRREYGSFTNAGALALKVPERPEAVASRVSRTFIR